MTRVPGNALNCPMRNGAVVAAPEPMTQEANHLKLHAATIVSLPEGYRLNTREVAYALSLQLQVPRHNIRVSRLRSGHFLADFMMSPRQDQALCTDYIEAARGYTGSPPTYRQAGARGKEPMDCWAEDMELLDRGRSWFRSPSQSARKRDYVPHAAEDWERHRSRSPVCQGHSCEKQLRQQPPLPVSSDPIADLSRMPIHSGGDRPQEDDPMLQESLYSWTVATAQPDYHPDSGDDALASLVYEPVSALRERISDDGKVDDISDHLTNMDIDTIAGYEKEALADDSSMLDGCPMEHDIYDDLHADLAINAIKSATRMGNKKLAKVLATMAEESNAVEKEVQ